MLPAFAEGGYLGFLLVCRLIPLLKLFELIDAPPWLLL
uniref:Uncharacterized protein n=1 Tax=Arundo donax TaxID=35708 RepID=A0A0A9GRD4_ARUDO